MMTELLALSPEILHCIFSYADERSQERLRLANRLLAKLGRPWAFRTARISVTEESWAKFQNILDDGALAGWVTKVYIDTYIPDHDFADYGDEDADDLPQPFWQLVKRLGELPRLKSVALRFHPECASDENFASTTELQTIAFRATVMQKLTASLASLPRPLSELAIHNLQNINPTDPETVANLTKVLTGLRSFRLNITNEMEGDREPDLQKPEVHEFYPSISSFWLKPMTSNLEHLTIDSNMRYGFYPKCDLREVHFQRLKSLALGNYTFVHDSQLEWILAHGSTLQELYLDDCVILYEVATSDTDRTLLHPTELKRHPNFRDELHASYERRWHDYFRAFNGGLSKLQHFRFGTSPRWDPSSPFELETMIEIGFGQSYMAFCDAFGPHEYMENMIYVKEREDGNEYEEGKAPSPSEEDTAALKELLIKLGQHFQLDKDDRPRRDP